MSKITRRDFLKTAGVMTLAVAAAGVLSGCEGNAEQPNKPETGAKALGDVITVGDYEFSVTKAVLAQTKGTFESDGTQNAPTERKLGLVFSVKATKADAVPGYFDFTKVKVLINGKALDSEAFKVGVWGFTAKALDMDVRPAKVDYYPTIAYTKNPAYFQLPIACQKVQSFTDVEPAYEEISKIEVIVNDEKTPVYVTYDVAVPAVKTYDQYDYFTKF